MVIDQSLTELREWAAKQNDITGVLLVGSHARGQAREDSDVDVVILANILNPDHTEVGVSVVDVERTDDNGTTYDYRYWYVDFGAR